ncbi:glycine betaine ABC transporter substrate-binding protein [Mesorhizobium sp. LCM 4576]|uniref:glycine betaine/L-proline ABC transporter substrate-binding protein ProX n=1 Tax=Mesorhizobium sp. LCM 4576 TaxID=1848289 RepID=UPI0008DA8705|nr:glycine betaine/L-proline ABC transporter substrate-binding protein ProX [Mesorhizobium sp. LCM 4576]OHV59547.1 glycine betaine ABC transporter substrate-binding protein [Mesorhizobium sp. LCM 4576]OHV60744.1 glycine betaine ABC transporter substrate-binding protein [Mesorhizobium sp. LCM 4576]
MRVLTNRMSFGAIILACTIGAAESADKLPGAGISVQPADQNYADEWFERDLVSLGLEDLGYNVKQSASMQFQAAILAVGTGDATFYATYDDPLHKSVWEKAGGPAKLEPVGTIAENFLQGYLIDKKTADAYHIKTINQFKDPKIAKLFDNDGDGKAELYGCQTGWGCERVIEHQLDAYGLRDTVQHLQGSYEAIIADAVERIKAGTPTLYYSWSPMWLTTVLTPGKNVVWLTVDHTDLPKELEGAQTVVPGLGNLGFTFFSERVLANKEFLDKNPAARKWFELLKIPQNDISANSLQIHEGHGSAEDILKRAEDWRNNHRAQWDAWIAEAKAAAN